MFFSPAKYLNKPYQPIVEAILNKDKKENSIESILNQVDSCFKNSDDVEAFQKISMPSNAKFKDKDKDLEKKFNHFFKAFVKHHLHPESKLDYKDRERAFFNLYMKIKMLSYDDLTQQFGKTVEENTTSFLETGVQKFEKTIGLNLKK